MGGGVMQGGWDGGWRHPLARFDMSLCCQPACTQPAPNRGSARSLSQRSITDSAWPRAPLPRVPTTYGAQPTRPAGCGGHRRARAQHSCVPSAPSAAAGWRGAGWALGQFSSTSALREVPEGLIDSSRPTASSGARAAGRPRQPNGLSAIRACRRPKCASIYDLRIDVQTRY